MTMVGRLKSRGVFSVAQPSGSIFFVGAVVKSFFCSNVMCNFRREISVVGRVDSTNCRFLSSLRVAIRECICRIARFLQQFIGGTYTFLRDRSSETMSTFMGNIAKNLVKW